MSAKAASGPRWSWVNDVAEITPVDFNPFTPDYKRSVIEKWAREEGAPVDLATRIFMRGEGSNADAISSQGAAGIAQITPPTFSDYAKPGEAFGNEEHRTRAALRKIAADYSNYGGDEAKTAAAYIGGRGAVQANGAIKTGVADANGTTPAAYAQRVAGVTYKPVDFDPFAEPKVTYKAVDFDPFAKKEALPPGIAKDDQGSVYRYATPEEITQAQKPAFATTTRGGQTVFTDKPAPEVATNPPKSGTTDLPERFGTGFLEAGAQGAKSLALIGAVPSIIRSAVTGDDAADTYFKTVMPTIERAEEKYKGRLAEPTGTAGQVAGGLGQLAGTASQVIGLSGSGPSLFAQNAVGIAKALFSAGFTKEAATVALKGAAEIAGNATVAMAPAEITSFVDRYTDLVGKGYDAETARKAALVSAGTATAMGLVPVSLPGKAVARVFTGAGIGVGANVAGTTAQNLATSEHPELQQNPLDPASNIVAAVGGGLFGGAMGREARQPWTITPVPREPGESPGRLVLPAPEAPSGAPESVSSAPLTPEVAAATANMPAVRAIVQTPIATPPANLAATPSPEGAGPAGVAPEEKESEESKGTRESPIVVTAPEHLEKAGEAVNVEPSEAQAKAGNYAKGHISLQGLDITLENPKGSVRSGTGADGKPWTVTMPVAYGYVKRTEGADGDQVDVFVGDAVKSPSAFIIDQINPDGFDEHKAMLGFPTRKAALQAYEASFSDGKGKERIGAITSMSVEKFKDWLKSGDTALPLKYEESTKQPTLSDLIPELKTLRSQAAGKGSGAILQAAIVRANGLKDGTRASFPEEAEWFTRNAEKLTEHPEAAQALRKAASLIAPEGSQEAPQRAEPQEGAPVAPSGEKPTTAKPEGSRIYGKAVSEIPLPKLRRYAAKGGAEIKVRARAEIERRESERVARKADAEQAKRERNTPSLQFLREIDKMGGVNLRHVEDITGEKNPIKLGGMAARIFRRNGLGIDDVATYLLERGYITQAEANDVDGGVQRARDLIRDAVDGRLDHSPRASDMEAELEREWRRRAEQEIDNELGEDWGIMSEADKETALDDIFGPETRREDQSPAAPAEESPARRDEGETRQEAPAEAELALSGQTPADLTPAAEAERQAEIARREEKAIADREAGGFGLQAPSGTVSPQPLSEPRNQRDMFAGRMEQSAPEYSAEPFYSELTRKVEAIGLNAATPAVWKNTIQNLTTKGVKRDEIEWSGVSDWLATREGRIAKGDILDFLNANGVQVQEVELGGAKAEDVEAHQAAQRHANELRANVEAMWADVAEAIPPIRGVDRANLPWWGREMAGLEGANTAEEAEAKARAAGLSDAQLDKLREYGAAANEARDAEWAADGLKPAAASETKFDQYTLPGGSNYRELLLTLPVQREPDRVMPRDEWLREQSWYIGGQRPSPERVDALYAEWAQREERGRDRPAFNSSHWNEPNILAHVRFNERTDAQGRRVLFIEEIQSDWAQQGKKKGFALLNARDTQARLDELTKEWEALAADRDLVTNRMRDETRWHRVTDEMNAINDAKRDGVPAAPFVQKTDSWTALALKRMIRYAADNGFDRIAWTTGEQQVERYTGALRHAVDSIEWKKTPEGVHLIGYKGHGGLKETPQLAQARQAARAAVVRNDHLGFDMASQAMSAVLSHRADWVSRWGDGMSQADIDAINNWIDVTSSGPRDRQKVVDTTEKENALSDAIGKAMAERIISDPNQSGVIEGDNIRIDSTGMAGFYDRIVPSVANDVLKKLGGGRVSTTTMGGVERYTVEKDGAQWAVVRDDAIVDRHPDEADARRDAEIRNVKFNDGKLGEQPGFDITDAMRERVAGGVALFQHPPAYNPNQLDLPHVYDNAQTRPGTTPEQTSLGIAALKGLFSRDRDAGASLLGSRIWRDFQERKGADLVGQRVESPQDLATLAQILRDPRFETLRIFYTKDGEVIGHTGMTSRLPGVTAFVAVLPHGRDVHTESQYQQREQAVGDALQVRYVEMRDTMGRLGADGYWLLHNHPSGRSNPSDADMHLTQTVRNNVKGFRGHVIIDHDEYSVMTPERIFEPATEYGIKSPQDETPELAHDALGSRIASAADLMGVAQGLKAKSGYATLVSVNGKNEVSAIAEVPDRLLSSQTKADQLKAMARVRRFGRMTAGMRVFVVSDHSNDLGFLVENNVASDVASYAGTSLLTLGRAGRPGMINAPANARDRSSQAGIISAEQGKSPYTRSEYFKRWFGDSKVVDENGEPLVVYHGTRTKGEAIDRFDSSKAGSKTDAGYMGRGFYFSDHRTANAYAGHYEFDPEDFPQGGAVYPAYLSLRNPVALTDRVENGRRVDLEVLAREAAGLPQAATADEVRAKLESMGYDGAVYKVSDSGYHEYVAFHPEQIKSAVGNRGTFDPTRASIVEQELPPYIANGSPGLKSAASKIGTFAPNATITQKLRGLAPTWKKRLVQGLVDQYAPLKELSYRAYVLARMTKSADSALEGMLLYGKPKIDADGAIVGDLDHKGFLGAMRELNGEHDRFLMWVAGNRASRLISEGREHLFSPTEITAMQQLNSGQMNDGSPRGAAYSKALRALVEYNKAVMDIAESAGLIDGAARHLWENDFYVPFYREMEDDTISGPSQIKGLVRQQAFKKLKGGDDNLGDLMSNTLQNWSHLISASLRNQAAVRALEAASRSGVAHPVPAGTRDSTFAMIGGRKAHFIVDDPFVLTAISALEWAGFKGAPMQLMSRFKRYLTLGVTVGPPFRIRNLIRDSLSAIGQNPMSYNVLRNLTEGFKGTKKGSDNYAQMLFGGGVMRFGTFLEGNRAEHAKRVIEAGIEDSSILDTRAKVTAALGKVWDAWQELGDKMENVNRAALYQQLRAKGESHLDASYAARDMLDFSLQGSWTAVRLLTQVVPFMNARAQGLYKLGRAAKDDPKRMAYVTAAVALASILLMLAYKDDEDWKKREDWDRDTYWWFKVGGHSFRIPKPFEIGAIGTLAERSVELMVSAEMTGKRFASRLQYMLSQTFAMNPTPQLVKPMIDIYANTDSFTGRQIESDRIERLSKPERQLPSTSGVAKTLGAAGNVTQLSPAQIDFMIRAYFGWLGTHVAMSVDLAAQPFKASESPTRRINDMFVVGDFVKKLPEDQSRYVEEFYKQAKEVSEAVADIRNARQLHDFDRVRELHVKNQDKLALKNLYENAQEHMGTINRQIRTTQESKTLSGDEKRAKLDDLTQRRNAIAERVANTVASRKKEQADAVVEHE